MGEMLDYYKKREISPVKQNIDNISLHYKRREKLYRQLGIPTIAFENKSVLEVGPGSGYNALAFLRWGAQMTLVEPNPTGVEEMRRLFSENMIDPSRYSVVTRTLEEFDTNQQFDIVIAEGFIHFDSNASDLLKKLSGYVKQGGVIVTTCHDYESLFIEQIKRLIAHVLIRNVSEYNKRVDLLTDFFKDQFKHLPTMSRSVSDWIKDDILNPSFNSGALLGIEDAIRCFSDEFDFLGSSQRMFTDYSWYKDIAYDERSDIYKQYHCKQHNLLMTGLEESLITEAEGIKLRELFKQVRMIEIEYEKTYDVSLLEAIIDVLTQISKFKLDGRCLGFIDDVISILSIIDNELNLDYSRYASFYYAVGRSMQYISMMRRVDYWEHNIGEFYEKRTC